MNDSGPSDSQIRAFNYITVEKARLYRALMRLSTHAKARFALRLRPREVLDALRADVPAEIDSLSGSTAD